MVGERDHHGGCPGQASFIASLTHVKQEGREPKKSLRTVRAVSSQRKTFSSPHPDRALDQKDVREFALICIKISPVPLENLERELALGPWLPGPGFQDSQAGVGRVTACCYCPMLADRESVRRVCPRPEDTVQHTAELSPETAPSTLKPLDAFNHW